MPTTVSEQDEQQFWWSSSERSLAEVWDNHEDDIYAQLLPK